VVLGYASRQHVMKEEDHRTGGWGPARGGMWERRIGRETGQGGRAKGERGGGEVRKRKGEERGGSSRKKEGGGGEGGKV